MSVSPCQAATDVIKQAHNRSPCGFLNNACQAIIGYRAMYGMLRLSNTSMSYTLLTTLICTQDAMGSQNENYTQ